MRLPDVPKVGQFLPLLMAILLAAPLVGGNGDSGGAPVAANDPASEPYVRIHSLDGHIVCSIGFTPLQTEDKCNDSNLGMGPDLPPLDPSAQSKFRFELDPGLDAVVATLTWDATTPLGDEMALTLAGPDPFPTEEFQGTSPVNAQADLAAPTGNGIPLVADVRAADNGPMLGWTGTPNIPLQQPFSLCIAFFYNGAEPFDACAEVAS